MNTTEFSKIRVAAIVAAKKTLGWTESTERQVKALDKKAQGESGQQFAKLTPLQSGTYWATFPKSWDTYMTEEQMELVASCLNN